ncbi:MAG: ABC transporter permease [Acidobacteria bacterium]|nr:MAG: ABC transporter permease [Acidobacteriota bacterium]
MYLDNASVMLNDLRHGFRVLMQAKGWTGVVVLSLAVGIGANAAVFTAVNGLLLRKLPVEEPDSLVRLRWGGKNEMSNDSSDYGTSARGADGSPIRATFSYPMFRHFKSANQTMTDLAATRPSGGLRVTIDGRAETASALMATGNYHALLGVAARIGRTLEPDDDNPAAPAVAVLSDRYWRSRFSADQGVLGKTIRVNGVPVTIVGVTVSSFTGTQRVTAQPSDLTLPIRLDDQTSGDAPRLNDPTAWWVQVTGRLKPGMTPEQVRGNLEAILQRQARAGLEEYLASASEEIRNRSRNQGRTAVPHLLVDSASRGTYDNDARQMRALTILGGVVGLVLLLVCANVANLLLSRATARQREISVRLSMGATRVRLIRQLLTESLLLAGAGGVLGLVLARWGQPLLPAPVGTADPADWRIFMFTAGMTMLAGIVFGFAPALRATKMDVGIALKENSRSVAGSNAVLSRALLVMQVSISVVLLVGSGLFLHTLTNLRSVDVGFDPQNLVFIRVDAEGAGFSDERKFQFVQEGMIRLRSVAGVRAATVSKPTLLSGSVNGTAMFVQGRAYPGGRAAYNTERDDINRVVVAPNYFDTMGIPVVAGRGFSDGDDRRAPEVAIINEAAARKFFPNENPVGRRFGNSPEDSGDVEIVGVLRDVRYNSLREPPPATLYVPHLQTDPEDLVFTVRTTVDPSAVLSAVRGAMTAVDPNIPILAIETQSSHIERRYAQERVLAQATTLFGGIALFVAAIGLFGLMSYNVSRRTREIGIRMAMGAQREAVLGLVFRESMLLVACGIVVGLAVAVGAGRLVASQLFGLEPTDALTIIVAIMVMTLVSAAAGYLPARRATRVDPMVALRYE